MLQAALTTSRQQRQVGSYPVEWPPRRDCGLSHLLISLEQKQLQIGFPLRARFTSPRLAIRHGSTSENYKDRTKAVHRNPVPEQGGSACNSQQGINHPPVCSDRFWPNVFTVAHSLAAIQMSRWTSPLNCRCYRYRYIGDLLSLLTLP
jgi:hypothetical protein